jgi:hypothetical protein
MNNSHNKSGSDYVSKTGRKNNTKLVLTIPSKEIFTHDDLVAANPSFVVDITLRSRFNKELSGGKVKNIGTINNLKGRPKNVYAVPPITNTIIQKAKDSSVILHSEYLTSKVADINPHKPSTETQPTTSRKEYAESLIFAK